MRVVIGGMNHESNTFNPIITGPEDFVVFRGEEMLTKGMLPYYSSTGIINTLSAAGCEIIPTVLARAVPNGVVSGPFYQSIKSELIERIKTAKAAGPIDGICLGLHGSMKVEGIGCAEGDLLTAIRELLPDIPLTVALDMHATITPEMLKTANAFVGYKTAPHIDCQQTGEHAARMLLASLETGRKLYTAYRRIPMLVAGEKSESEAEPMKSLIKDCRDMENRPGVEAASFLLGFPWADTEHNACCALVSGFDDPAAAEETARELAERFWKRRRDFSFRSEYYDSAESMKKAYEAVLEKREHPVFVSDSGDNPTAGAAGDATDILERIMETMDTVDRLPTQLLYSGFYDAPAAEACIKAGTGAMVDITVGGNWDTINGKKIPIKAQVKKIVRDFGPYHSDLVLISCRNMLMVLTSKHIGFGDDELLPALGVNAAEYCLVVVKLGYLEPCFRTIAQRAIMATSKGCSNEVLESIPYKLVRRPLYPLDPDMECSFT
ncbi:M81 family metallopeptidase [Breznakiella homolactica]|uniref:M81 family metallopeptidase n=1 Tax=Breznakiella homolactica TaxID=2798577 RepID=A0A7T8BAU1_9SPIR|nr:M81 family metallopeptidase [Breznakiella homolactica]QQO09741.1 M81 family metallopeptidase [Breznakiella homolactica]